MPMPIQVFTTCPRSAEPEAFHSRALRTFELTERAGFTGTLIYTGNDVTVEPWFLAQELVTRHPRLSPLVAVNPIYMHPFTVARFISALASIHGRRCHLNLVAGTSLRDLEALDEELSHDERYQRVREFARIVMGLCSSTSPYSFGGDFYGVANLLLRPPVPAALRPGLFVAGQSAGASQTATALQACGLGMLQPDLGVLPAGSRGVHLGLVCRDTDAQAWSAAHALFPPDERGERMQRFSARNTDAVWKARMLSLADDKVAGVEGYWLEPFSRFQADCPFLVGGQEHIHRLLRQLLEQGIQHLVLELPAQEEDYVHAARAFASLTAVRVQPGDAPAPT
ncbi:LLM class flavin-dependent oxidoreductase [Myxococcus sp. K38C18041901]|uniref:LLM class flavin-dependent oxidoreductase n=1 Tax=Myxococcus guangdongensis TaxID=2906760 RepID=UPI0020A6F9E0|nr:LLM class flavin-dependent oxidoreductase [Myxococcus guangdongensis]MCP3059799.1 LLM class flavin-dependent oxidoreductase [Myxococcus guangdongensis]